MVELLLEAGADPFKANASGTTALMVIGTAAAGVSGIAIVEVRLAVVSPCAARLVRWPLPLTDNRTLALPQELANAAKSTAGDGASETAPAEGRLAALLNATNRVGDTALHIACRFGNAEVVTALAAHDTALDIARRNQRQETALDVCQQALEGPSRDHGDRAACLRVVEVLWSNMESAAAKRQAALISEFTVEELPEGGSGSGTGAPAASAQAKAPSKGSKKKRRRGRKKPSAAASAAPAPTKTSASQGGAADTPDTPDVSPPPAARPVPAPQPSATRGAQPGSNHAAAGDDTADADDAGEWQVPGRRGKPTPQGAAQSKPRAGPASTGKTRAGAASGGRVARARGGRGGVAKGTGRGARRTIVSSGGSDAAGEGGGVPASTQPAGGHTSPAAVHSAWRVPPHMLPSPLLTVGDAGGGDGGGVGVGVGAGIADGGVTVTAADLTSHLHARFPKAEAVDLRAHHLVGEQLESLSAGQLEVRAQKCGCVRLCLDTHR